MKIYQLKEYRNLKHHYLSILKIMPHDIIDTIENTGEMSKECEEKIRSSVEDCKKRFVK